MKNLDQIRAANALDAATSNTFEGVNQGDVVKKIPAMIRENGFMGALAFAVEKQGGHHGVFSAIIRHLADERVARIAELCTPEQLVQWLSDSEDATSARLRDITAEALAYLNFLRRFAGRVKGGA